MSLIRQTTLLLVGVLWLALIASLGVHALGTHEALRLQAEVRNRDDASLLALALSQQGGDPTLMRTVAAATFDLGHYRRLSLRGADGQVWFDLESPERRAAAPRWLVALMPIQPPPGLAQVSNGWRELGRLEVSTQSAWAHESLWSSLQWTALLMVALGLAAGLAAAAVLRAWQRPLEVTMAQAQALEEGRFVIAEEPKALELRRLTRSMNSMVTRLRQWFDAQAAQVDALQHEAHTDAVTGAPNRRQFMGRLESDRRSAHSRVDALLIVRVQDLPAVNQRLGHEGTDRMLAAVGEVLQRFPHGIDGSFVGRLNGSDFALALTTAHQAERQAQMLMQSLRGSVAGSAGALQIVIGGVDDVGLLPIPELMATADAALAQAEADGAFSIRVQQGAGAVRVGEHAWRQRIEQSLDEGRARLTPQPVRDAQGKLLHLSCPLRLQLEPDGEYLAARHWLPLAGRSQLLPRIDLRAIALALDAMAQDGRARAVHMAASSLAQVGFIEEVLSLLRRRPAEARQLIIEVTEPSGDALVRELREAVSAWRAAGARVAIDDAGGALQGRDWLTSLPLHHVRVGGRRLAGVASDGAVAPFARSLATLVHGLGFKIIAGDVDDPADLAAIWAMGFDGASGAAVAGE